MALNKQSVLKKFAKKLPDGAFFKLSDEKPIVTIPTGISALDYATGIGGFARGTQTQLYGPPSSSKTATALQMVGNYQKEHEDSYSCIIDLENSMTVEWAVRFGIDPERLVVLRPSDIEEMITMSVDSITSGVFDIIVVDSLGAGLLRSELDNDKSRMGGSSGAITRMVKAVNSAFIDLDRRIRVANETASEDPEDIIVPAVIYINQARADLSSMYGGLTFSGGNALQHMLSMNIRLRASKATPDKIEGTVDGNKIRVGWCINATIEKNKLACPGKTCAYNFVFQECQEYPEFGIDNARSVADLALLLGIARVEGKTIYYPNVDGEEVKVVGRNNFLNAIREDKELTNSIAEEIARIMTDNASDEDLRAVKESNKILEEIRR